MVFKQREGAGATAKREGQAGDLAARSCPLRDIIVFPHMVVPLFVGREKSIAALDEAMAGATRRSSSAAQKKAKTNDPTPEDIFRSARSAPSCSCCGCPTAP